ncbi:MAG: hypothetical protein GY753_12280 [Gammaproteobacteria bacterium]|nr:hypothetical protein [Gammaproteobacteria bacterium]
MASNSYSTSVGYGSHATAGFSSCFGVSDTASGQYATAIGYLNLASGANALAVGVSSVSSGDNATALGSGATASGNYSLAALSATATGNTSMALNQAIASGTSSNAIGSNAQAYSAFETAIGRHNTYYAPASTTTWNSADRLFVVGNGTAPGSRSDALVILKNGDIGSGTSSPSCDVHIKQKGTSGTRGLRLEFSGNSNYWDTYVDVSLDYNFEFNGVLKSYIQDTDGSYVQISDRRLKEDIEPLTGVLDKVTRLNGYTYRMKGAESDQLSYGLISQEVEVEFPDMIHHKDGIKMLSYGEFAPLLVESVKELNDKVETLEAKLAQLEEMILKE